MLPLSPVHTGKFLLTSLIWSCVRQKLTSFPWRVAFFKRWHGKLLSKAPCLGKNCQGKRGRVYGTLGRLLIPNIMAWILLVLNGKVERRLLFIHLCFWIFCSTYPDCVHGQLSEKWEKTLSVLKTCPRLTVYGSFPRFPHKDFIAFFRIVFAMRCRPTEDIGIYFWRENKNARQTATRKHAEKLLIFGDYTILWRKCCSLQFFSLLGWLVDDYLYHVRPAMLSSGF